MKKILGIIVLSLLWCNTVVALPKCIGEDTIKWTMCEGTLTYADGSIYVGGWNGGFRQGQGTFTYANGSIYIGEWKEGLRNGWGTSIEINGKKNIGQFRNEKFIEQ